MEVHRELVRVVLILISEHQGSLPALNIVSLAVILACSIVFVVTNALITIVGDEHITTLVCELQAFHQCCIRRLREVVAVGLPRSDRSWRLLHPNHHFD